MKRLLVLLLAVLVVGCGDGQPLVNSGGWGPNAPTPAYESGGGAPRP